MLSEEALEKLSERLIDRIEELNLFMIEKLGNQIVDIGELTPSQLREVFQSIEYGNNLDEIVNKIADITDKNVKDIYDIFEEVAKQNQQYAKKFYEYRKIKYIPYEANKELQKQVKTLAKATANNYLNISKNMAYAFFNDKGIKEFSTMSETYQKITDRAIISIAQGRESFDMVMKRTMKELSSNGLRNVNYANGYSRRMDTSVRMNIMDGIRTLNRELQEQFGEEFGADGVEVSHHKNAAPDHIDTVDGKQFTKEQYEKVNNDLDRHVGELNCYHFVYSIVMGVSKPMYSKEQLEADKKANTQGFGFEGEHYTNYEGTQLMRSLETKIRQYKDRQIGAKSIKDVDEVYHCQNKIEQLTKKYSELSKASGLPTKVDRLRVEGYRKVNISSKKYEGSLGINKSNSINDIYNTKVTELGFVDKSMRMETIEYYENKIFNKSVENAIIVQSDGKVIKCVGCEDGVGMYGNFKNAIITHNHPTYKGELGGSISVDDFKFLANHQDIKELRAVDEKYNYSVKLLKEIKQSDYGEAYINAIPTDDDFKHCVMQELANKGLIKYERKLRKRIK